MSWNKTEIKNGGWKPGTRFVEVSAYDGALFEAREARRERDEAVALLRTAWEALQPFAHVPCEHRGNIHCTMRPQDGTFKPCAPCQARAFLARVDGGGK